MTQYFQFWVRSQKKGEPDAEQIFGRPWLWQHYSQRPRHGNDPDARQRTGQTQRGPSTRRHITRRKRVPSRAAACTQLKDVMRSETSQSPRHRHREACGPGVPGESHSQTEMRRCAPGAGRQHLAGGGGTTAARTHVTLLNATLKTDRNGKFYVMCILPPFKKKNPASSVPVSHDPRHTPPATPQELTVRAALASLTRGPCPVFPS